MQTSNVDEKKLGNGIDARNSENQLTPGFWEGLLNAEGEGDILKKRKGYQQLGGYLPFRVQSIDYASGEICFTLDSYVDLLDIKSSPIVVRGTAYGTPGTFDFADATFSEQYYSGFDVSISRIGTATGTPDTYSFNIPQEAHGHNSWIQHSNVYEVTSTFNLSNSQIYPDEHYIDSDANLTLGTGLEQTTIQYYTTSNTTEFYHASYDASTLGTSNYYPTSGGLPAMESPPNTVDPLVMSFDIAADTELQSSNLIISVYQKNTGDATIADKILPDDITIDGTTVDITINTSGPGATSEEYFYVATAVPDSNVVSGQVTSGTQTVTISGVTPFTSYAVYTIDAGVRELVIADSAVYDDTTQELTITFQSGTAFNYQIYYLEESTQVSKLCVTENVNSSGATGNLDTVELDVYGIDPMEAVTQENRNHWLTHIDTYRSEGNSELLSGVAGVSYKFDSTDLSTMYPRYEQILESDTYLAPLFQSTGQTFTGSGRGFLTCTDGFDGLEITDIAYQSGSGLVRFTLSAPALDITGLDIGGTNPSNFTDNLDGTYTSSLENDLLTVTQAGYSILNDSHSISSMIIDTNTSEIFIDCSISAITDTDYDEADVGGTALINTSPFTIKSTPDTTNTFIPGTTISILGNIYTVRGNSFSSTEKLYISGVTSNEEYTSSIFIFGSNTAYVHPVRTNIATTVDEYVKGDTLQFSTFDRWLKIKDIVQLSTTAVTLNGTEVDFGGGTNALNFQEGQKILLLTEGLEGTETTVTSITSDSTMKVSTTFTDTSARLIGKTFELDENLTAGDTIGNTFFFTPTGRWHALQKPSVPTIFTDANKTVKYPFDVFATTNQETIRSTMVADNMYYTNGEDSIIKYDGANISRAGLYRLESGIFVRKTLSTGGAIVPNVATVAGSMANNSKVFTATTAANAGSYVAGQTVIIRDNLNPTTTFFETTVREVDTTAGTISVEDASPSAGTFDEITDTAEIKYYVRLNMIDANNNIIGSAATGVDNNYVIQLSDDTTVGLKLAKPSALPLLDYDRLEYEIYRTKQDGSIFYKLTTINIDYTSTDPYVYYEDTTADDQLTEADVISTSLFGAEIATTIDEPLRAKYITSANNRLVLGNLKTAPTLNVRMLRPSTELSAAELNNLTFTISKSTSDNISFTFKDTATANVTNITDAGVMTLSSGSIASGTWVYLYKTSNSQGSPEPLGWYITTGTDTIPYNGPTTALTNVSIIEGTGTVTVPIFSGTEYTDDEAAYQSGSNQLLITSKLVNAINAVQYQIPSLRCIAEGRADSSELGVFRIKALDNDSSLGLNIIHPAASPSIFDVTSIFINNSLYSSGTTSSAQTRYASRMLVSFPNFPEMFDKPTAIIPEDSQSIIDVNSADGQEITGIIPFFGDSTSQDSQKQDIVICFKENSIYAINISTRQITKIDSRGIGCNAPSSIAAVPNGIIFAAKSGIYRLNRSFQVIWIGRYLDRLWNENTNLDQLALATGHVYPQEKQYRLSVPVGSDEQATEVYVYGYGEEQSGQVGAWYRFNNIPATGWASDGSESYFGATTGRMYTIRNTGTDSDYRDDASTISWECTYRGMDFGAAGIRKLLRAIISHFRGLKTGTNINMEVAVDMKSSFVSTTSASLTSAADNGSKVNTIRHNIPTQKGVYFQVKFTNSDTDTPIALCGITFVVAGLDYKGIKSAIDT